MTFLQRILASLLGVRNILIYLETIMGLLDSTRTEQARQSKLIDRAVKALGNTASPADADAIAAALKTGNDTLEGKLNEVAPE